MGIMCVIMGAYRGEEARNTKSDKESEIAASVLLGRLGGRLGKAGAGRGRQGRGEGVVLLTCVSEANLKSLPGVVLKPPPHQSTSLPLSPHP